MSGKVPNEPSKLIKAIRNSSLNGVLDALDDGADIEEPDMHGQRGLPLRTACFGGNLAIIRELLERGADINAAGSDGPSAPIRLAVRANHHGVVGLLVEYGATIPDGLILPTQARSEVDALQIREEPRPTPRAEIPPLEFESISIASATPTPSSNTSFDPTSTADLIGDVDLQLNPSHELSFGTETRMLSMDLLRFNESDDDSTPLPSRANKETSTADENNFWKSGRPIGDQ